MTRPLSIDATIRTYVKKLEAELAEARAQIAAKDAALKGYEELSVFMSSNPLQANEIRELQAQIAAKDAALRLAWSRLDPQAETAETIAIIEAALAAPARKTE